MSTAKKKDEPVPVEKMVVPHAYGMVEDPDKPGYFFAVLLENATAEKVVHVEPNGRSSYPLAQIGRIKQRIDERTHLKQWGRGKK